MQFCRYLRLGAPLIAGLLLFGSFYSSYVWVLIPVSICLLCIWSFSLGGLISLGFLIVAGFLDDLEIWVAAVDRLAWVLLSLSGFLLYLFQARLHSLFWGSIPYMAAVFSVGLIWYFGWAQQDLVHEMKAAFFPNIFEKDAWPEEMHLSFENRLLPLFQLALPSLFAFSLSLILVFNTFILAFFLSITEGSQRLWQGFSEGKLTDKALIPLVGALLLLILFRAELFPEAFLWGPWLAWNLFFLAFFPFVLNGIACFSFLLPRISFIWVLILIWLLVYIPLPILVLLGLADIWFDFRRRMGSNS